MKIALDAMGGDYAPDVTIAGAIEAVTEADLEVILVGDRERIQATLSGKRYPQERISILHASEVVGMDESPSTALRKKKDSSVRRAVELVRDGAADAVVSAGHSGVMMATSLFVLGKLPHVDRPAIAAMMPGMNSFFVVVDAGANVDCKPENLLEFGAMGNAYYQAIFDEPAPRVGLLSNGEEDTKGNELTKETFGLLKHADLNFVGNIEGKDVFIGVADVIVCDGFTGNVLLKVSEGLADTIIKMLKREIASLVTGKIGYLMMKPAIRNFKKRTDYDEYGGAPLLGINGTSIVCHGRSTTRAIKNALKMAAEMSKKGVHRRIAEQLDALHKKNDGEKKHAKV